MATRLFLWGLLLHMAMAQVAVQHQAHWDQHHNDSKYHNYTKHHKNSRWNMFAHSTTASTMFQKQGYISMLICWCPANGVACGRRIRERSSDKSSRAGIVQTGEMWERIWFSRNWETFCKTETSQKLDAGSYFFMFQFWVCSKSSSSRTAIVLPAMEIEAFASQVNNFCSIETSSSRSTMCWMTKYYIRIIHLKNTFTFSEAECSSKGGVASGSCASGFGVCCVCELDFLFCLIFSLFCVIDSLEHIPISGPAMSNSTKSILICSTCEKRPH